MFAKLLKYEIKATAGTLGLMTLAAVVATAVGAGVMQYMLGANKTSAIALCSAVLTFAMIGLVAYYIGGYIYLLLNYHKSKFTDRGYLTFTLPVRGWQIFLSSLLNVLFWSFVISAVLFLGMMAIMIVATAGLEMYAPYPGDSISAMDIFGRYTEEDVPYILFNLLNVISNITVMLTCITVAGTLCRRRRLLASIGIYYGYSLIWSVAETFLMHFAMEAFSQWNSVTYYTAESLILFASAAGCFVLSSWLMDKKVNLN